MKLIPAVCPNCGANIKLKKDEVHSHCDFCNSDILVDDAIKRYKIEVTSKIEIENLPKLNNYIKLGMMHYNDNEYDEAYNEFSKAIEIDPDNFTLILRKGLSKSLFTNYANFDIDSATNGYRNAIKILEKNNADQEIIDSIIMETKDVIDKLVNFLIGFYKKNTLYFNGVDEYISRLIDCIHAYDLLIVNTIPESDLRDTIIADETNLINYTMNRISYKRSDGKYSRVNLSSQNRTLLYNIMNRIQSMRSKKLIEHDIATAKNRSEKNILTIRVLLCIVSFLLSIIGFGLTLNGFIFLLYIACGIILIPPVSKNISNKIKNDTVLLVLQIALFSIGIILIALMYRAAYVGTYVADGVKAEVTNNSITLTIGDNTETYSMKKGYISSSSSNASLTKLELSNSDGIVKYIMYYNSSEKTLCIKEKKQPDATSTTKTTKGNTTNKTTAVAEDKATEEECLYKLKEENK